MLACESELIMKTVEDHAGHAPFISYLSPAHRRYTSQPWLSMSTEAEFRICTATPPNHSADRDGPRLPRQTARCYVMPLFSNSLVSLVPGPQVQPHLSSARPPTTHLNNLCSAHRAYCLPFQLLRCFRASAVFGSAREVATGGRDWAGCWLV
ncbi:hypothetical protein P154DRAFT_154758 [Amniculicola lignicola CBS 123094]|uniref:Uncharacterized protein n=1 Tax=Amniculicola lignicola CBS 123094 TaxID=1392246 RepID=A0A6A5WJN6_9PLEO|nr:hypothetical protein P154DRAFT_154758 [Amniculicola lignicola CBS 123094]